MASGPTFRELLDLLHGIAPHSYDFATGPAGALFWRRLISVLQADGLARIEPPQIWDADSITKVVQKIIES